MLRRQKLLGHKPAFNPELEEEMVELEPVYHGVTRLGVRRIAYHLATRNRIKHPFGHGQAGRDW